MNYINGDFAATRPDFASINPSTEEPLGYFPQSTRAECDEALTAARRTQPKWAAMSRLQRGEYFDRLCQILKDKVEYVARAISLETGKNLNESRAEVVEGLHMAQYCFGKAREPNGEVIASELPERDSYVIRKPKGVVVSIAPWNFPFAIGGFWTAGPALLEGNTVILKPSEDTPMVGQIIAELYQLAGFPAGVFNLIHGDGSVGDYLANAEVDHICFTGSAEVGQHIRKVCANSWHKTCSCELGSKSACMVFDDADQDLALAAMIASAYKLSGQRCVSSGRMLIQQGVYDSLSDRFAQLSASIKVGDPFDEPDAMFGPLINRDQHQRVHSFNEMTYVDSDVKVLVQATSPDRKGFYITPHVYKTPWGNKPFLKKEVFGPHVALIPFATLDEAVSIYNDTEYGLSLGVITSDFKKAREVRNRCDFGLGYWNGGSIAAESHLPFGGLKKSGNGQPSAAGTFDAVTHRVAWTVNHGQLSFPQGLK
jgi:aldehyde dehydrogenase (NAD+)